MHAEPTPGTKMPGSTFMKLPERSSAVSPCAMTGRDEVVMPVVWPR